MYCQNCKINEATIHLTEISDGQRSESHLCEKCAQDEGITLKSHVPINELLSKLLDVSQPVGKVQSEPELSCPYCGFTIEHFNKEPLIGCPFDYEIFEKPLLGLIEKAHNGKTVHCGKIPSHVPSDTKRQSRLLSLRHELDSAVRAEDYERAARLRDELKECEH